MLALCLTSPGAFATSLVELVQREGIFYKKFSDVPFAGKVGEGAWRGVFKNGEFEGPWVAHYDGGHLWSKGEYKNGKFEGSWVAYREDGTKVKVSSGVCRNDKKSSD